MVSRRLDYFSSYETGDKTTSSTTTTNAEIIFSSKPTQENINFDDGEDVKDEPPFDEVTSIRTIAQKKPRLTP